MLTDADPVLGENDSCQPGVSWKCGGKETEEDRKKVRKRHTEKKK
jgi:hypothetical protein